MPLPDIFQKTFRYLCDVFTICTEIITNENLEIQFRFAFVMERQINSPKFSFAFAFVMVMLGTHKPQQRATLTNKDKIPEMFFRFRFRNSRERNYKYWDFYLFWLVIDSVRMVLVTFRGFFFSWPSPAWQNSVWAFFVALAWPFRGLICMSLRNHNQISDNQI